MVVNCPRTGAGRGWGRCAKSSRGNLLPVKLIENTRKDSHFFRGRPTEKIWYYDLSDIKVGKKTPFTIDRFEEFFRLLLERGDSDRSWTVTRGAIVAKNFDLKAVNPNAKNEEDTRTPEELLDLIEAKGQEVAEVLTGLRKGLRGER